MVRTLVGGTEWSGVGGPPSLQKATADRDGTDWVKRLVGGTESLAGLVGDTDFLTGSALLPEKSSVWVNSDAARVCSMGSSRLMASKPAARHWLEGSPCSGKGARRR